MSNVSRAGGGPGSDKIVAISLLTTEELRNVGTGLKRLYPVPDDATFDELLAAIDRATKGRNPGARAPKPRGSK